MPQITKCTSNTNVCVWYMHCISSDTYTSNFNAYVWYMHFISSDTYTSNSKVLSTKPNLSLSISNFPFARGLVSCNLRIWGNILNNHCSLINSVSNEMLPNVYMLGAVMKHWILRESDTTMIFTVYNGRFHHPSATLDPFLPLCAKTIHLFK